MKKILLMCCFLVGITAVSRAQGGGTRMTPAERAKELQTQLKLTDDQTTKITVIYQDQSAKMDSVRKAANGDRQAMRQAMMPMRKESNEKIKAILTADQASAYEKLTKERMGRTRQGGNDAPPPPPSPSN